jgi:hypothetical protein
MEHRVLIGLPPDRCLAGASNGHLLNVRKGDDPMIALGVILLVVGFVLAIPVLWTIGIILAVAGVALAVLGTTGRMIGGRAHWY